MKYNIAIYLEIFCFANKRNIIPQWDRLICFSTHKPRDVFEIGENGKSEYVLIAWVSTWTKCYRHFLDILSFFPVVQMSEFKSRLFKNISKIKIS